MGTWATSLFGDDTACDVRDEFAALRQEGADAAGATAQVLNRWGGDLNDPETGPVVRLALAATLWEWGCPDLQIRDRAVQVIDSGEELDRWSDDVGLRRKRAQVLQRLRKKLLFPPPAPKKVRVRRKRTPSLPELQPGEIVSFEVRGKLTLLHIVERSHDDALNDDALFFLVFPWCGRELPTKTEIKRLSRKKPDTYRLRHQHAVYVRLVPKDVNQRLNVLGTNMRPRRHKEWYARGYNNWEAFETSLAAVFELVPVNRRTRLLHELGVESEQLAVWDSPQRLTHKQAEAIFRSVVLEATDRPRFKHTKALSAFEKEVKALYADADPPPWWGNFFASERFVRIRMNPDTPKRVMAKIRQLARKHGLVAYNPITGRVSQ